MVCRVHTMKTLSQWLVNQMNFWMSKGFSSELGHKVTREGWPADGGKNWWVEISLLQAFQHNHFDALMQAREDWYLCCGLCASLRKCMWLSAIYAQQTDPSIINPKMCFLRAARVCILLSGWLSLDSLIFPLGEALDSSPDKFLPVIYHYQPHCFAS